MLVAFKVRSFRFQFFADLLTAWAIEMEVLILGWYVLTRTDSPLLLSVLGALRFGGTLLTPLIGSIADRVPRKSMLVLIRAIFAGLALVLMSLSLAGLLQTWHVFTVATLTGLIRPADMMLRQSLIADAVPREALMNAMGFARITVDSARIVGALLGAGLMAALGIGPAYAVVSAFYGLSVLLTLGVIGADRARPRVRSRPFADLLEGVRYLRGSPVIIILLGLAFLVNLTALSLTGGLLPVVARDVYGLAEKGLGVMVATFAGGALIGSVLLAGFMRGQRPERVMLISVILWHLLIVLFAQFGDASFGLPVLGLLGLASSFTMVPMASSLMMAIEPQFRARIMGVRQLAVFSLPIGLLLAGALIEQFGVRITFSAYGVVGLLVGAVLTLRLRRFSHELSQA